MKGIYCHKNKGDEGECRKPTRNQGTQSCSLGNTKCRALMGRTPHGKSTKDKVTTVES